MFSFYLKVYRSGMITFCGVGVNVNFEPNGSDGKFGFREYDNGRFKLTTPKSRHSNILRGVIIGKKGWGLFVKNWSEGIGCGLFTKYEFFEMLNEYNITLPDSLYIEFNNAVWKEREKNEEGNKIFNNGLINLYNSKKL